jgi:2-polyprenyl-3-methyl-5-hydroxy-6-metoxy-1,4-benzoquinol methylase
MDKWRKWYDHLAVEFGTSPRSIDRVDVKNYQSIQNIVTKTIEKNDFVVVVDVGCGNGTFSKDIARSKIVYGIDFSFHQLRYAQDGGIQCIQSDALKLPLKSDFSDTTLCMGMLQLLKSDVDVYACFKELTRITKPGGLMILSTLNAESLLRRVYGLIKQDIGIHFERMFFIHEVYALLKQFHIEIQDTMFFYTPFTFWNQSVTPGLFHRLFSATFLVVGRKPL